jgi:PHD/YefM family antitoxin component YafN of YafNO toxin-antitoxin module
MDARTEMVEIETLSIDLVEQMAGLSEPVVLTREGKPLLAVMAVETLRRLIDERELLRRLALGELESAASDGVELETVLDECRQLVEGN